MERALSIGEVSALYDLPPSTLRWWEKLGVLAEPARTAGRRTYDERAVRRIGLAYLCCVVGRMPLAVATVITSGRAANREWRRAVDEQVDRLDREIAQLRRARAYLERLRRCTDDDPVTHCPYLADEIRAFTPRGRTATATASGDEMRAGHTTSCRQCGGPVAQPVRGRRRRYCSQRCRGRAHRMRNELTSRRREHAG